VSDNRESRRNRSQPVEGGGLAGFVFGLLIGFLVGVSSWTILELSIAYAIAAGVIVGLIGFFFGDRFWFWASEKLHWF
jgi:hypothetical protein